MSKIVEMLGQRIAEYVEAKANAKTASDAFFAFENSISTIPYVDEVTGETYYHMDFTEGNEARHKAMDDANTEAISLESDKRAALYTLIAAIAEWDFYEGHEADTFDYEKLLLHSDWRKRQDAHDYDYVGHDEPYEDTSPQSVLLDALIEGWKRRDQENET